MTIVLKRLALKRTYVLKGLALEKAHVLKGLECVVKLGNSLIQQRMLFAYKSSSKWVNLCEVLASWEAMAATWAFFH
jgi:hypothetical protein